MSIDQLLAHPDELISLSKKDVKELLSKSKELYKKRNEPSLVDIKQARKTFFAGDIHGDFIVMKSIAKKYLESSGDRIVFLGDILDRAPLDCPYGSVHSMLLAFVLKLRYPDHVLILRGNHEGDFLIKFPQHELDYELEGRFGDMSLHEDFVEVFRLLPIMARTPHGIFCAHGGIPKVSNWMQRDKNDVELNAFVTWGDTVDYGIDRGFGGAYNFSKDDVKDFLDSVGAKAFVRGHDYMTLGMSFYDNRCLTILSSRRYQKYGNGGVLLASSPSDKEIKSAKDIDVMQLVDGKWIDYEVGEL